MIYLCLFKMLANSFSNRYIICCRMEARVCVEVSDRYLWGLQPFAYLFNLYWSSLQPVTVFGYSPPPFLLPSNFSFFSIDTYNYPAEHWSDGFKYFLGTIDDDYIILLLVDYWLCRTVDVRGVSACFEYIRTRPDVLRIDLTADRLYSGGMFDVESWGCYDIIETPHGTPYQFSTQAGIWNRRMLMSLLEPNKSPWEVELYTPIPDHARVLGTRQYPVRYANAILKGKIDFEQLALIPVEHRNTIMRMIPSEYLQGGAISEH